MRSPTFFLAPFGFPFTPPLFSSISEDRKNLKRQQARDRGQTRAVCDAIRSVIILRSATENKQRRSDEKEGRRVE